MAQFSIPGVATFEAIESSSATEWRSQRPVRIGWADRTCDNVILTTSAPGREPSGKQVARLIDLLNAPREFRSRLSEAMFREYVDVLRPAYLANLADKRFSYPYSEADLPELLHPDGIWELIGGLRTVWIEEDGTRTLEWSLTYDPGHELSVVIGKNGEVSIL